MKRISFFLFYVVAFAVASLHTACEKMEEPATFNVVLPPGLPTTAYAGRELAFDVGVEASAGLEKIEVRMDFQSVAGSEKNSFENASSDTYSFLFTPTRFDIGRNLTFVIVAHDKRGYTTTATHHVTVEEAPINISMLLPSELPETIFIDEHLEFEIQVVSEMEIRKIETLLHGMAIDSLTQTEFADPFATDYRFSFSPGNDDAGMELVFTVRVTDEEEKTAEVTYTVTVDGDRAPQPIITYTAELGSQMSAEHGHFLNLATGSVHFRQGVAAISADIDLLLFYSSSTRGNLAAPDFQNAAQFIYTAANSGDDALGEWPTRNNTKLANVTSSVTEAAFEAIEKDDALISIFEGVANTANALSALAVGNVTVFQTADGKHGLIRITKVPENNADSMVLEVKVQQ
ncbi:hypothetical protein [Parapedobacter tibetensis]|uniref:hypothetical protein n=1 Tax=Parapedobacter tibetensis TaxID=2972951 RepID=UPI00214DD6D0|nr:hypothetical protein [Parapedobacter tibetensis]